MNENYLTKNEAAEYLRISERTLDRIVAQRGVLAARVGTRKLLFRKIDLDEYIYKKLKECAQ